MSFARKNLMNISGSIIAVIAVAAISLWQFYVFVTFRDANGVVDPQGGISHLWWALVLAVIACAGGFFVFSVCLRHDRDDELHITS
jgi:hypothetical protein